jgi:hypothetical protein
MRNPYQSIATRWKRILWLATQPARPHWPILIQLFSAFGTVVTAFNGACLVASVALMIAAYTSLTGASNMCIASGFVSHTIGLAQDAAREFLLGSFLSLLVAAMPWLAAVSRNILRVDDRFERPPIPVGKEFEGITTYKAWVIFFTQLGVLLWSLFYITLFALNSTAFNRSEYSQRRIQAQWQTFEEACKPISGLTAPAWRGF